MGVPKSNLTELNRIDKNLFILQLLLLCMVESLLIYSVSSISVKISYIKIY